MAQTTIIDGVYVLKKQLGKGGMAAVYLADVDLTRFDYIPLYAYTQVPADSHTERMKRAADLVAELRKVDLPLGPVRTALEEEGIPLPGAQVAVKIALDNANVPRFEGEWKNLLCLNHPHVIQVYGGGVYKGRPYYAMEYLENMVAIQRIKDEFTIREKLEILVQAGRGLQYLHDHGLIHRDIKPDNMVTCEVAPGTHTTKITDLGLAKNVEDDKGLTMSHTVMGSPSYMSPQQFESSRDVDHTADIYSLGASLYEYVTGVKPYHNKTTIYEVIHAVSLGEKPIRPQEHMPDLPAPIAGIIETAMEWDPADRYETVADMVRDIEEYLAEENQDITRSISFAKADRSKSAAKVGAGAYAFEARKKRTKSKTSTRRAVAGAPRTGSRTSARRRVEVAPARKANWMLYAGIGGAVVLLVGACCLAGFGTGGPVTQPRLVNASPSAGSTGTRPGLSNQGSGNSGIRPAEPLVQQRRERTGAEIAAALVKANPGFQVESIVFFPKSGPASRLSTAQAGPLADISPLRDVALRDLELGYYKYKSPLASLESLRGMPLTKITLWNTEVRDLGPLAGMPLTRFSLNGHARVSDLSPLRGMKLTEVRISECLLVTDISPLRGMPIKALALRTDSGARIALKDLSAVAGMPLEFLDIGRTEVSDLVPLRGMALKVVKMPCTQIRDLAPLAGMPLTELDVGHVPDLQGTAILRDLPLERVILWVERNPEAVRALREHKTVNTIGVTDGSRFLGQWPALEFWQKYDAGESGNAAATAVPKAGWVPLYREPADLGKWPVSFGGKPSVVDGAICLQGNSGLVHSLQGRDMAIRALLKKRGGQNLSLILRWSKEGQYVLWFNGGQAFGIGCTCGGKYNDLKKGTSRNPCNEFFELGFSAVGDTLTATVDGEEIIQVKDARLANGAPGIGVYNQGDALFKDIEVRVLDAGEFK